MSCYRSFAVSMNFKQYQNWQKALNGGFSFITSLLITCWQASYICNVGIWKKATITIHFLFLNNNLATIVFTAKRKNNNHATKNRTPSKLGVCLYTYITIGNHVLILISFVTDTLDTNNRVSSLKIPFKHWYTSI